MPNSSKKFHQKFCCLKNANEEKKMNIQEIIAKKREQQRLTKEEIAYFIQGYTKGEIGDEQAAALVMAIYLNGMDEEEITDLTMEMAYSGDVLDLSRFGTVVDKHSTGGIGDKVTLILMPTIAALGVPVAKMSGRGLGYTGGTIDKLESIPGYQTGIAVEDFIQNVEKIGISLIGQTLNLAPADKKLYALRDTISCTESIPLIASSIMSKKIAAGASKIVLDVTCGSGAFMKKKEDAIALAKEMNQIGKLAKKETVCVLTNMEEPLGKAVGNSLEVIEAIEALNGKMEPDVEAVVTTLGAYMLKLAGKGNDIQANQQEILSCIQSGKALKKFKELVANQGGDVSYIENPNQFPKAEVILEVRAMQTGYVQEVKAEEIGRISMLLGAGRKRKEDLIKPEVGIVLEKKVGDFVEEKEVLATIHAADWESAEKAKQEIQKIDRIVSEKVEKQPTILGIVTDEK